VTLPAISQPDVTNQKIGGGNGLGPRLGTSSYLPSPKTLDHIVPLSLGPLGVDDVNVQTVIYQFMKEFLCPLNALYKHQHGRGEALQWVTR